MAFVVIVTVEFLDEWCSGASSKFMHSIILRYLSGNAHLKLESLLIHILAAIWQGHERVQATVFAISRIGVTGSRHHGTAHARLACQHLDCLAGLANDGDMRGFVLHAQTSA